MMNTPKDAEMQQVHSRQGAIKQLGAPNTQKVTSSKFNSNTSHNSSKNNTRSPMFSGTTSNVYENNPLLQKSSLLNEQ